MSEKSPDEIIREALERRDLLKADYDKAHKAQYALDFVELVNLEEQHGFGRVMRIDLGGWEKDKGAATLVVVRIPERRESFFKRYEQTVARSKPESTQRLDAAHQLAMACLLYPSKKEHPELHEATLNLADGVLSNIAYQIANVVQGKAEDEKKG